MKAIDRRNEQRQADKLSERRAVVSRTVQPLRVEIGELQRAFVLQAERIDRLESLIAGLIEARLAP